MTDVVSFEQLTELRRRSYRQTDDTFIHSEKEAVDFINDLGFVWLIDLCEADLPSLRTAAHGSYDDLSEGSAARYWWDSKQTLSGRKACYYAKVLRGRGTFISWQCFPHFYAAYATRNDYADDYQAGTLSRDEKRVLDLIAAQPEISSRDLRRQFGSPGKDITRAMDRALQNLQESFRITVAGGSIEGWSLHHWALVEDWVPSEHLCAAGKLSRRDGMKLLILRYVRMAVAASVGDTAWVFRWKRADVETMLDELVREGTLRRIEVSGLPGEMFAA